MKISILNVLTALFVVACVPAVEMPGVLDPLDDPKWKECADQLAARQEQAMLDDLMLDTQRLVCQGVVTAEEGRVDKSMSLLSQAAVKDPKDHRPHYLAGRILTDAGRYDEALTEFDRSHERYPSLEIPTERLGRTIKKTKGPEEAAAFLERAMERKLCSYGCMSLLAETYHELDKDVFAKPVYEKMTAEEPWEPGGFVGLASLSNTESDFIKEVFYLDKATSAKNFGELSPEQQASIYYSLAFAKYNSKDYDGAASVIDKAIGLNGDRADWQLLAGWINLKRGNAAGAVTAFEAAEQIDFNLVAIPEGIGDAKLELEDIPGAESAYRRAHRLDRGNAIVTLKLAHAVALNEDLAAAKKLKKEAVETAGEAGLPKDLLDTVTALIKSLKQKKEAASAE